MSQKNQDFEQREIEYAKSIEPYLSGILDIEDDFFAKVLNRNSDFVFDKTEFAFIVSNDDLEWIMDDFVSTMMGESEYARRFLQVLNLENPRVKVNYTLGDVDSESVRTGVWKAGKNVYLETPIAFDCLDDDTYLTTFHHIATAMHEVAHTLNECNSSNEKLEPKLWESVEVESLFVENLFYLYLSQFAGRVAERIASGKDGERVTKSQIEDWVKSANEANHFDLYGRTAGVMIPEVIPEMEEKPFAARYVIGEVYAKCLIEEFKRNPRETIEKYHDFVRNNAGIESFDELASVLFPQKILNEKFNSVTQGSQPRDPHDVVVKYYGEIIENEIGKSHQNQGE